MSESTDSIRIPETIRGFGGALSYALSSKKNVALAAGLAAHAHAADLGIDPKLVFFGTLASVLGIAAKDLGQALRK